MRGRINIRGGLRAGYTMNDAAVQYRFVGDAWRLDFAIFLLLILALVWFSIKHVLLVYVRCEARVRRDE